MEREYNRNQRSYRPRRNDSREDYQAGKGERREKPAYGERKVHREYNGNYSGQSYRREEGHSERKLVLKKNTGRDASERRPRINRRETTSYNEGYRRNREETTSYNEGYRRNREDKPEYKERGQRSVYKKDYGRERKNISNEAKEQLRQKHYSKKKILAHRLKNVDENAELRLNRFISMGGVCSRRDADELIVAGRVKVNGVVVQTVGQKVHRTDKVEVDDVQIFPEKKIYLVLNKPKDYVTTVEDPLERKTVMSLIQDACKERIYPVGRLDRQTTGVLLFTNDGDLAKKLTHPKYDHKKIYHVFLDKPLEEEHLEAIAAGVDLEDGFIKADEINYTSPDCTEVGIEIHSGKNRIVRRIFEHFGYQIVKLDRVYFAGITKKNIPRGKWRFLTPREVNMLKVY